MKIKKLEPPLTYSFDGVIVRTGPMGENSHCPECGKRSWFHYRYDAAFCPHCNKWIEKPYDMEFARMRLDHYPIGTPEEELPPAWSTPMRPLDYPVGVIPVEDWLWVCETDSIVIQVE